MTDLSEAEKGHQEALTPEISGAFPGRDDLDQAVLALRPIEGKQLDLLAEKAETQNAARRAAGRPFGSVNRRNDAVFDALERWGYKNPIIRLMEIVSASPYDMGIKRAEAIKLQIRAAEALLPYMLARKPQELKIDRNTLHVFMAGPLQQPGIHNEQNQWLAMEGAVRQPDNVSHDQAIAEQDQGVDPLKTADLETAG